MVVGGGGGGEEKERRDEEERRRQGRQGRLCLYMCVCVLCLGGKNKRSPSWV